MPEITYSEKYFDENFEYRLRFHFISSLYICNLTFLWILEMG